MRFLIATVVLVVTMTVSFESNSKFSRDLQEHPRDASTVNEQIGSGELEHSRDRLEHSRDRKVHAEIEPNTDQSMSATFSDVQAAALVSDGGKQHFCEALKEAAESSDIPIGFFARLLWQESKFQPGVVSHAGAQGVAQFMPATAAEVGLDDPFDPFKALPASAKLLRRLHNQFGNLGLAAAAYNAGSGRIQKWLSRRGVLPQETRDYVRIITGNIAEKWLEDSKLLDLHAGLPRGAPCEGVGGLTTAKTVDVILVGLTPSISDAVKKAGAEAAVQRRTALKVITAAKAVKIKLAMSVKRSKAPFKQLASRRTSAPKQAERPRQVKVASATVR